jgi:hypothetical protein
MHFASPGLGFGGHQVPGADCRHSISGIRVAREVDWLLIERGKPKTIVSDNGTEFTTTPFCAGPTIAPGKLAQNALAVSSDGYGTHISNDV